jgi:hypothetical protein
MKISILGLPNINTEICLKYKYILPLQK